MRQLCFDMGGEVLGSDLAGWGFSVWSLHVLAVTVWISSGTCRSVSRLL